MNDAQAVLLKLLSEIDEVCLENNIPYFLANKHALSAYRCGKFESDSTHLEILMLYRDAIKLSKRLADRPNRVFESIYTNSKYPDFSFRYCDTATTRVMLDRRNLQYENHCLCVFIEILRAPYHGRLGRRLQKMEKKRELHLPNSDRLEEREKHTGLSARVSEAIWKRSQKRYASRMGSLFRRTQLEAGFDEELFVRFLNGDEEYFPKKTFSTRRLVFLEGQPCFIAGQSEEYFVSRYGRNWREKDINPTQKKQSTIVDPYLPYRQFKLDMQAANQSLDFSRDYAQEQLAKRRYDAADEKITEAWNLALRTGAKFKMRDLYTPCKQEIISLFEQEKWPELIDAFQEYDSVAVAYEKEGLLVNFDDELLDVYLNVLHRQGRRRLERRLKKLLAEEKTNVNNVSAK